MTSNSIATEQTISRWSEGIRGGNTERLVTDSGALERKMSSRFLPRVGEFTSWESERSEQASRKDLARESGAKGILQSILGRFKSEKIKQSEDVLDKEEMLRNAEARYFFWCAAERDGGR